MIENLPIIIFRKILPLGLVPGLGLDHSCPWPREGLSSKSRSLALAQNFLEAFALASNVGSLTPPFAGISTSLEEDIQNSVLEPVK